MKNILILAFLFAVWHTETISGLPALKDRLQYLTDRKMPYMEVCSIHILPDIDNHYRPVYTLIYETLEDAK